MNKVKIILGILIFASLIIASRLLTDSIETQLDKRPKVLKKYKISRILQGDTIELINIEEGELTIVELACINAPEPSQIESKSSRNELVDLINELDNYKIVLNILGVTKEKHLISEVFVNDINLNVYMVSQGAAVINPSRFNCLNKNDYIFSQKIAKDNKLNIWANENFIMPWDWKNGERN